MKKFEAPRAVGFLINLVAEREITFMSKNLHFAQSKVLLIRAIVPHIHELTRMAFFAFEENLLLLQNKELLHIQWRG